MNSKVNKELYKLLSPRMTKYIPCHPSPKQAAFLLCNALEVMYGGAARGGKSIALLMGGLQYVDVPGYHALILRRTITDLVLPGALMSIAQEWLTNTDARWDDRSKSWCFPSGATLTFGHCEAEKDKLRYQGSQYHYIAFDEASQFSETQYRYLFSRLCRVEGSTIPIRMRAASNPGGPNHVFLYERFIKRADKNNKERVFIPAKLEDNPYIDQKSYDISLQQLDHITRAQLRDGNWEITTDGKLFQRIWFTGKDGEKIVGLGQLPRDLRGNLIPWTRGPIRYWDIAATTKTNSDFTACVKGAVYNNCFYILDVRTFKGTPQEVENYIKQVAAEDGPGVKIYIEQEPGSSGVIVTDHYTRTVLSGYAAYGEKKLLDKVASANPFSAAAENGFTFMLRADWNAPFLDELEIFDPINNSKSVHDDMVDAASGCYRKLFPTKTGHATFSELLI